MTSLEDLQGLVMDATRYMGEVTEFVSKASDSTSDAARKLAKELVENLSDAECCETIGDFRANMSLAKQNCEALKVALKDAIKAGKKYGADLAEEVEALNEALESLPAVRSEIKDAIEEMGAEEA